MQKGRKNMKKLLMMFIVLGSISFAASEYKVIGMEGSRVKVEKLSNHKIYTIERSKAATLGINLNGNGNGNSNGLGKSFVNAMMPGGEVVPGGEVHPSTQAPMDVIGGTVTAAYGAK
jgi:hypothetical protein